MVLFTLQSVNGYAFLLCFRFNQTPKPSNLSRTAVFSDLAETIEADKQKMITATDNDASKHISQLLNKITHTGGRRTTTMKGAVEVAAVRMT